MHRPHRSIRRSIPPVFAALVVAMCALSVGVAFAEPLFTITGRGWGNGVGMSQEGAKRMAQHGYAYPAILRHYFSNTKLGTVKQRTVRVSLQASGSALASWTLRGVGGDLRIAYGSTRTISVPAGTLVGFRANGAGIVVWKDSDGDGRQDPGEKTLATFGGAVTAWARVSATRSGFTQVHGASGPWGWNDILWRGQVRLTPGSGSRAGRVYAVDHVLMDDYLRGVVPRETPAEWPMEALKAQAVAARAYAIGELKGSRSLYDMLPTTVSQVYNGYGRAVADGIDRNEEDRTDTAVKATAGQVVMYGRKVVTAFFFSTSGGRTENIENVWPGSTPVPYLVSVADPYEDATAPGHIWKDPLTLKAATMRSRLAGQGLPVPGTLTDVMVTKRGVSGRAMRIVLKGAAGDDKTLKGATQIGRFRRALGLKDTWLYVTRCAVSVTGSFVAGGPIRAVASLSPAPRDGTTVVFRYGDARAAALPGIAYGKVSRGVAVATITGRSKPTDVIVTSGKAGTSTLYRSGRYRAALARSVTARVTTRRTVATVYGSASPATGLATLRFDVLPPGSSRWRVIGSARAGSKGSASITYGMKTAGLWRFRAYSPASAGFIATTSSAKVVYNVAEARIRRFAGADRYATSVALAEASGPYPRSGIAVVAGGKALVDAGTAAALAAGLDAPLLLTEKDALPATVRTWLADRSHGIKRIVVVGGTGSVSTTVLAKLEGIVGAGLVTRVSGADRYVMAASVASTWKEATGKAWSSGAVVANGDSEVDILVASAAGATLKRPVLLVKSDAVPAATAAALSSLGVRYVMVVGGPGAVSDGVAAALGNDGRAVVRSFGATRYATACSAADRVVGRKGAWTRMAVVPDSGLADAVSLAPYLARGRGVLLLSPSGSLDAGAASRIHSAGRSLSVVATAGGLAAVPAGLLDAIHRALP